MKKLHPDDLHQVWDAFFRRCCEGDYEYSGDLDVYTLRAGRCIVYVNPGLATIEFRPKASDVRFEGDVTHHMPLLHKFCREKVEQSDPNRIAYYRRQSAMQDEKYHNGKSPPMGLALKRFLTVLVIVLLGFVIVKGCT